MPEQQEVQQLWAKLELMGHKVLAGLVTETVFAGKGVIRVDVPGPDGTTIFTQYFSPDALYCLTPVSRDVAIEMSQRLVTAPVSVYDIRALATRQVLVAFDADDPGDQGAAWWLQVLGDRAVRWRPDPGYKDPNAMLQALGPDALRAWVLAGLQPVDGATDAEGQE